MSDERRPDAAPADPRVDAAWRAVSREEPPSLVDDAILAAARMAVRDSVPSRPPPVSVPWQRRWQPLAAAAAVTGLAFVLVQMLPRDEPIQVPAVTPAPAGPAARETVAPAVTPEAEADVGQPGQATAVTAPSAAPVPVAKARQESALAEQAVGGVAAQSTMATDAASVAAARSAPPAARTTLQGLAGPRSADAWVSQILDRHAAGDLDAAAADLRAFRAAYPDADAHLPEPLRAWAATVAPPAALR
jgi:hypothetical protein